MSRGFVKEDDQEEIPIVPPRADLPSGVTNYVTQVGLNELVAEKEELEAELLNLETTNEQERRIATNHINAKLKLLTNRIFTAKTVDISTQPTDEVRFGATVTLKIGDEKKLVKYQLVGVDEANIAKGKISFISPIARILINKKVGETIVLQAPKGERKMKIVNITYV